MANQTVQSVRRCLSLKRRLKPRIKYSTKMNVNDRTQAVVTAIKMAGLKYDNC